jgi:hypothetical protein
MYLTRLGGDQVGRARTGPRPSQSHIFKSRRAATAREGPQQTSERNGKVHIDSLGLGVRLVVGLAERGQRLVEEPPFELDQFGLDPYVDPELSELISGLMRMPSSDALYGYSNN